MAGCAAYGYQLVENQPSIANKGWIVWLPGFFPRASFPNKERQVQEQEVGQEGLQMPNPEQNNWLTILPVCKLKVRLSINLDLEECPHQINRPDQKPEGHDHPAQSGRPDPAGQSATQGSAQQGTACHDQGDCPVDFSGEGE